MLSKRTWSKILLLFGAAYVVAACTLVRPVQQPSNIPSTVEVVVFGAASLTDAFEELGAAFTVLHPNTKLVFNFAGSQQLAQQLAGGAPADVFASANQKQMQVAVDAGRVAPTASQPFAHNRLVVVIPASSPAAIVALADLAKPGVKVVLADAAVPVGQYALDFLTKASASAGYPQSYGPAVLANVVSYEENVRAVLTKVQLGEADAGIVYASDIPADVHDQVIRLEIPDELNVMATYPIAPIRDSSHPALAAQFVALVLSPEGQQILANYGFIPLGAK